MATAHVMQFSEAAGDGLDRVGGTPSHLPDAVPMGSNGLELAFVAQFEVVAPRFDPGIGWLIQVYQDPEGDPWPHAVVLDRRAVKNVEGRGRVHRRLPKWSVSWESIEEPVEPGDWDAVDNLTLSEEGRLQSSKVGGFYYYPDAVDPGEKFLLQLREPDLAVRAFGGQTLIVVINQSGHVEARLG